MLQGAAGITDLCTSGSAVVGALMGALAVRPRTGAEQGTAAPVLAMRPELVAAPLEPQWLAVLITRGFPEEGSPIYDQPVRELDETAHEHADAFVWWIRANRMCGELAAEKIARPDGAAGREAPGHFLYEEMCEVRHCKPIAANKFLPALKAHSGVRYGQPNRNGQRPRLYTITWARPPEVKKKRKAAAKPINRESQPSVRPAEGAHVPERIQPPMTAGSAMHTAPVAQMLAKAERRSASGKRRARAGARSLAKAA